jgi:hypothetical protein
MIAPARKRAPKMLLVIGQDEQGLPTETIFLEPSVSQLYDELRKWLASWLPSWLGDASGPPGLISGDPPPVAEPRLLDVRLRWAGL